MSSRTVLVMLLAVVCGVSAAIGTMRLNRWSAAGQIETTPVVAAVQEIPRGQMVTAEMVQVVAWPKHLAPPKALQQVEEAVDRAAAVPILPGDLVLDAKLAPRHAGRGMAALVPTGMRAYTIQTLKVGSSVAGFVLPGNRVDVLLTLKSNQNDETGGGSSTTLLQAVEILAVDQRLDAPADNKVDPSDLRSVTLLVTPRQAALLDLGQSMGQLSLSLRNPDDQAEADTQPATLSQIRFRQERPLTVQDDEPAAAGPPAPRTDVYRIRTLRGNYTSELVLDRK